MPDLYSMLQDANLMDENSLAYYHKIVDRLIKANNSTIKQEIINEVNTDISTNVTADTVARIDKLREELTKASEEDLKQLKNDIQKDLTAALIKKQDKIVGKKGQSITFDDDGNIIAVDPGGAGGGAFGCYYQYFDPTDWNGSDIHIPASKHGLTPSSTEVAYTVYGVIGHNITDYDNSATQLNEFKADIIAMYQAAIAANNAAAGTYPTDENGYIIFTWEQVQYYLLEDVLVNATTAAQKASQLNFNWKDISTLNVTETCTLQDYLNAAYMPALNGPATQFNNLSSNANIQAWHFRRPILKNGVMETGAAGKYDMNGKFELTWGAVGTAVHYDPNSKDLIVHCNLGGNWEGFVLVMAS